MPKVRMATRQRVAIKEPELSQAAYKQLIATAQVTRSSFTSPGMTKGEAAAATAYTVMLLSDGNVLVKVSSLARLLGVDLHTLTRGFQAMRYPAAPKEMQMRIRSDAARRMLRDDRFRKIDSIASELGYRTLNAFSKFFHQQNGISPMDFRKQFIDSDSARNVPF